ncbi:MAG: HNH endonuclease [Terracidiphilus sp.]|jgi:hypothetical protein
MKLHRLSSSMANSHKKSTPEGRVLCDSLYRCLREKLPLFGLERFKRGCAFVEPGQPKLCYIYHYTKLHKIQIWPYFDYLQVDELKQFVEEVGLPITPRNSISGMGRLYPLHIDLQTEADVRRAVKVLMYAREAKVKRDLDKAASTASKSAHRVPLQHSLLPEEISDPETFPEGGRKSIIVNGYERNLRARKVCIKHFGPLCSVCGFDFVMRYGALGKGFIHVHHIVKISAIGKRYKVDPKKDLRPVCPNCHAMLHRKSPMLGIEELKKLLAAT